MIWRNIRLAYSYIKRRIMERYNLINLLKKNEVYLLSGKYRTLYTKKTIIYIKDKKSIGFIEKTKKEYSKAFINVFKKLVKHIVNLIIVLCKPIVINNREVTLIKGNLAIITYSNNIKIFDFERNVVLNNVGKNSEVYTNIKQAFNTFCNYFDLTITEFLDDDNTYLEKYIDFVSYKQWNNSDKIKCIEELVHRYYLYFRDSASLVTYNVPPIVLLNRLKSRMKENETLLMDIGKIITSVDEGYLFPSIRLHGDLKFDNILLNSNKYYLIDLESSSEFVFFYDIFNLLTVGAGDGDFSYLKHYIEGAYDGLMEKLFISFNMKYNTNHRHYYFAVYLVELLLHDLNYSAKQIHYEIMLDNFRFLLMKIRTIGCPYFDFSSTKSK